MCLLFESARAQLVVAQYICSAFNRAEMFWSFDPWATEWEAVDVKNKKALQLQGEGRYEEALPLMKRSLALR